VSASFDGVANIRSVDARKMLAQVPAEGASLTSGALRRIGRSLGAGSVLEGSVVRVGRLVRFDLELIPTDSGPAIARVVVTVPPDSIEALTDSVTHAVLAQVWRRGTPPTPSLEAALKTRSVTALREFLEGERGMIDGRWLHADSAYARAIAADPGFWIAYWHRLYASAWFSGEQDPAETDSLWVHRSELPEADRLVIEAEKLLNDSLTRTLALGREATRRFPDNWFAWFDYGDNLIHWASLLGVDPLEGDEAMRKALEIDSGLLEAWHHILINALARYDTLEAGALLDTLARLSTGPGPDKEIERRRWQGYKMLYDAECGRAPSSALIDSVAITMKAGVSVLPPPWLVALGDLQGQLDRRLLALGGDRSESLRAGRTETAVHALQGDWNSALSSTDAYAHLAVEDSGAHLLPFTTAVVGAWLGALDVEEARRRRAAAGQIAAIGGPQAQLEMAWLDGLLGYTERDHAQLDAARAAAGRIHDPGAALVASSLGALALALNNQTRQAGESLAALQWQQSERLYREASGIPELVPISRLIAARFRLEAGDSAEALRLLRWTDGWFIHSSASWTYRLRGPIHFERARIEEGLRQNSAARRDYELFLRYYVRPVPRLRPMVDSAHAALRRLAGLADEAAASPR
jgi:hypothetical protein